MLISLLLLFFSLFSVNVASANSDNYCAKEWHSASSPSASATKSCAYHWIKVGYGSDWSDNALVHDPDCYIDDDAYDISDIRRMKAHLEKDCPGAKNCCNVCDRAIEIMDKCESVILGLTFGEMGYDMSPVLRQILRGEAIRKLDLYVPNSPAGEAIPKKQLRILRNAVFARHGRAFKSADLHHFFYGPDARYRFRGMSMPSRPDPSYSSKRLTRTDRANVKVIRASE